MTTDHDSDPDATVKMPRPVPPKDLNIEEVEVDPDSTLVRDDWGTVSIAPPQGAEPVEFEKTLRRPSYEPQKNPR